MGNQYNGILKLEDVKIQSAILRESFDVKQYHQTK